MKNYILRAALLFVLFFSLQVQTNAQLPADKGSGILYFSDLATLQGVVPNIQYGSEWAWVTGNKKLYHWDRDLVAWVEFVSGGSGSEEVLQDNSFLIGTPAPAGIRIGVDTTSQNVFLVDNAGLWQELNIDATNVQLAPVIDVDGDAINETTVQQAIEDMVTVLCPEADNIFYQKTPPTGCKVGDIWIDGGDVREWDGVAWGHIFNYSDVTLGAASPQGLTPPVLNQDAFIYWDYENRILYGWDNIGLEWDTIGFDGLISETQNSTIFSKSGTAPNSQNWDLDTTTQTWLGSVLSNLFVIDALNNRISVGTPSTGLFNVLGGDIRGGTLADASFQFYWMRNNVPVGGISSRNSNFTLFGGASANDHFIIKSTGFIGINVINPLRRLDIAHSSQPQIRLTQSIPNGNYFEIQQTGNDYTTIINSKTGTKPLLAGTDKIIPDNTDSTAIISDFGAIIQLSDTTDDANQSVFTIPSAFNIDGFWISIECKQSSIINADDGCRFQPTSVNVQGASQYDFTQANRVVTFKYSTLFGEWKIISGL